MLMMTSAMTTTEISLLYLPIMTPSIRSHTLSFMSKDYNIHSAHHKCFTEPFQLHFKISVDRYMRGLYSKKEKTYISNFTKAKGIYN